jgi:thioesterase domain-containing protein/acyl carrier protein
MQCEDLLELQLREVWENLLDIQPIGTDDSFFDLGGDSLLAVDLFREIDRIFGRRIPLAAFASAPTLGQLAALLREGEGSTDPCRSSPVKIRSGGFKPPLFCLPGSGGNLFSYFHLARAVGPDRPFFGLQFRGLEEQRAFPCIEDMAAHFLKQVHTIQPEGPYYLAGYSFGGQLAFEMAQQLRKAGHGVALLALLDTWGPGFPRSLPCTRRIGEHARAIERLGTIGGLRYLAGRIGSRLRGIARLGRRSFEGDHLSRMLDENQQANRRALVQYAPRAYPGRLTLFRAEVRPSVVGVCFDDPHLGWGALAEQGVEVHSIPGTHHSIFDEPNVRVLADKLKACLSQETGSERRRRSRGTPPGGKLVPIVHTLPSLIS